MPTQRIGDIDVYYEVYGDGPQALVMIHGLTLHSGVFREQTPEFARHFRTIVFDNRGAGRTDKPEEPYTMRQWAADTAALMNVLRIERAAILGVSMGGMIAQEFALNYPERLSCLILACTHLGGQGAIQPSPEIQAAIAAGASPTPEQRRLQLKAMFSDETIERRPEVIDKTGQIRMTHPMPPSALARRMRAIAGHDTAERLGSIETPTLVMTGRDDHLVAPGNARLIAERIPNAELKELPGGHLFFIEHPELFNPLVVEFITAHP
ncbi:MAG TPA: alpha/beta hydrolase [Candidatus Binataceae bacterium]|nr:alpha/beta hydrolase [Candidatus Binataceae bacterium]